MKEDSQKVKFPLFNKIGKKHGFGTEYSRNGTILYEGKFIEGERNDDNAKLYWRDGVLQFEGTLVDGRKQGFGKDYTMDGNLLYKGNFSDDYYHEKGKLYYKNKRRLIVEYNGNFTYGKKSGYGILYHDNGRLYYKGDFVDDEPCGENCTVYDENELIWYEGALVAGKKVKCFFNQIARLRQRIS